MQEIPSTRIPRERASPASSTVDIPTASPPRRWIISTSAAVSYEGPFTPAYTPVCSLIPSSSDVETAILARTGSKISAPRSLFCRSGCGFIGQIDDVRDEHQVAREEGAVHPASRIRQDQRLRTPGRATAGEDRSPALHRRSRRNALCPGGRGAGCHGVCRRPGARGAPPQWSWDSEGSGRSGGPGDPGCGPRSLRGRSQGRASFRAKRGRGGGQPLRIRQDGRPTRSSTSQAVQSTSCTGPRRNPSHRQGPARWRWISAVSGRRGCRTPCKSRASW